MDPDRRDAAIPIPRMTKRYATKVMSVGVLNGSACPTWERGELASGLPGSHPQACCRSVSPESGLAAIALLPTRLQLGYKPVIAAPIALTRATLYLRLAVLAISVVVIGHDDSSHLHNCHVRGCADC